MFAEGWQKQMKEIFFFQNMRKMQVFFFSENMLGKVFKIWSWAWKHFFFNILEKIGYFNTGFVFYNVNIQPDTMQN